MSDSELETGKLTRENAVVLIQEAERFERALRRERKRLFDLRRALRLAEAHLPENPEAAQRVIERAYATDEEIEQQVQEENRGNG